LPLCLFSTVGKQHLNDSWSIGWIAQSYAKRSKRQKQKYAPKLVIKAQWLVLVSAFCFAVKTARAYSVWRCHGAGGLLLLLIVGIHRRFSRCRHVNAVSFHVVHVFSNS